MSDFRNGQIDVFGQVTAPSTCPLKWDHIDSAQKQWHCDHCAHTVHNLSGMTRREARRFMSKPSKARRCISFLQDESGRAIFKAEPSPIRWLRAAAAFVTAATWPLLEADCNKAMAQTEQQSASPNSTLSLSPQALVKPPARRREYVTNYKAPRPTPTPEVPPRKKRWTGF